MILVTSNGAILTAILAAAVTLLLFLRRSMASKARATEEAAMIAARAAKRLAADDAAAAKAERLANEREALKAARARAHALAAVHVSGHTGFQSERMGVYLANESRALINDANVYTSTVHDNWHLFRAEDGMWYIGKTESMVDGDGDTGVICSTTASISPLGLEWEYSGANAWSVDRLLAAEEMIADEVAAVKATVLAKKRAAEKAAAARALAIAAIKIIGPVPAPWMGGYLVDEARALENGARVYKLVAPTTSATLLLRHADGTWRIEGAAQVLASTTSALSPLDLEWRIRSADGGDAAAWSDAGKVTVAVMEGMDLLYARTLAAAFAIEAVCVTGHTGAHADKMGSYVFNAEQTKANDARVYTLLGAPSVHLFFAVSPTRGPCWWIAPTEAMAARSATGWLHAPASSPFAAAIAAKGGAAQQIRVEPRSLAPTDLQWKFADHSIGAFVDDPSVAVTAIGSAELAATIAAFTAEKVRALSIKTLVVEGHVGSYKVLMGTYAVSETHSPRNDANVYARSDMDEGILLWRCSNGLWSIGGAEHFVKGVESGAIASTEASVTPLGLKWKHTVTPASGVVGWVTDPLLHVRESRVVEPLVADDA